MRFFKSQPAAVLSITGEDHQEFLQGQGTADLRAGPPFCRYNLWLDYKGRIIGDAFVLKQSESNMLLVSDATPAAVLIEKFDRHIIAEDVQIDDVTAQYSLYSFEPASVEAALDALDWDAPVDGQFGNQGECILFTGRRMGPGTLQVLSTAEVTLPDGFNPMETVDCEALRIGNGMPLLPLDSDQNAINPIEANILSAISFNKGCYLGQEVVARVERLGRVTRRLARFSADAGLQIETGALHQEGEQVGNLTSVVNYGDKVLAIGWLKSRIPDDYIVFDEGSLHVQTVPES